MKKFKPVWTPSVTSILREQKKSNDFFELMLANLSLEEIIALKLEVAYRSVSIPVYGMPVWKNAKNILNDALLKFAYSITGLNAVQAARVLGISTKRFVIQSRAYKIKEYFKQDVEELDETNRGYHKENISESNSERYTKIPSSPK